MILKISKKLAKSVEFNIRNNSIIQNVPKFFFSKNKKKKQKQKQKQKILGKNL
jgi:hypothetical protein